MNTNHTPGPWHVANGVQIRGTKDQIAKIWMMRGGEGSANAKLISTSPDLLDFAELVARMTTDQEMDGEMMGDDAVSTLSELIETARTLRNKAKGLT